MKIAVIGAGLQARRRIPILRDDPRVTVRAVVGGDQIEAAKALAGLVDATPLRSWRDALSSDIDTVIICTPPDVHYAIAAAALKAGKHVLCEKPLTRAAADAAQLGKIAAEQGVLLKCGFNHRHHPALQEAYARFQAGDIGEPLFGRAVYGIGGRPGYENEWRADSRRAAGGQLMEQGIHLVDLFRWFLGDFDAVMGSVATLEFAIEPLEDSGFALLQRQDGVCASVHSSILQWKNRFHFELYGRKGYLEVHGLGGSYGTETLRIAKRDPFGPFSETVTEFRGQDVSWKQEWQHFVEVIESGGQLLGTAADGAAAMALVEAAYESSRSGNRIHLQRGINGAS